jgi:ribosomal protein S18 acetylase RimI-like enzyme
MSAGSDKFEPPKDRKRLRMVLDLVSAPVQTDIACRTAVASDKEALAALMLDAYQGTVDYEGESLDDALREIDHVCSGSYGRFLRDCSFVFDGDAGLSSACLVTMLNEGKPDEAPLLVFAMTRKRDQRRGLSSALILRSVAALSGLGYSRLSLAVTADNTPACRLYERLGFRPRG